MISVVIVCAGKGTRMNSEINKVLLPLDGKPIFMHSVDTFKNYSNDIILVANEEDFDTIKELWPNTVLGGKNRQDSVYAGVSKAQHDIVLIHDGARPFVDGKDIEKLILSQENYRASFLGSKMINSIKDVSTMTNVNREQFVMAYTPQLVCRNDFMEAYKKALVDSYCSTDDVDLVKHYFNYSIGFVEGNPNNIKITTMTDYQNALSLVMSKPRIGHSWDTHRLDYGRKLVLGGVTIPFEKGLVGHSDADALLHAISEALLGALSLGDLGSHFPDNDPQYSGIDSRVLLAKVNELVQACGYFIGNVDTMIYAEKPKMKPYIPQMQAEISRVLKIQKTQISIKATTYEHMDAIGRGEAIAADATVILFKK